MFYPPCCSPSSQTIVSHLDPSVLFVKFSDDTTVAGLGSDTNEGRYRKEVERLVGWCSDNNLELNISKTKETIIDFGKKRYPTPHLSINGVRVELVDSCKCLGTVISCDLYGPLTAPLLSKGVTRVSIF